MADKFKFPYGGYDVLVLKKQDILDCIDKNIIDKEVALDIVRQVEVDATNFLQEGRWTGIPFIGNIRIPKAKLIAKQPEVNELIKEAREKLSPTKYAVFRKHLSIDINNRVKKERLYLYELSKIVRKNAKTFRHLAVKYGEDEAKIILYTSRKLYLPQMTDKFYAK